MQTKEKYLEQRIKKKYEQIKKLEKELVEEIKKRGTKEWNNGNRKVYKG